MSLPTEPIVKKFFTNKIESSRDDWHSYLIKIARTFYSLDGQEYNRDTLLEQFVSMSQRQANADRDAANFRDEFGAYGTYLGIFHFEERNGVWTIVVSDATKQFLCTENPNAAAFCRAQLSLFQYPNGAGSTLSANGGIMVQGNIKTDTMRELENNIRLNPYRLVCRIIVALHEKAGKKYNEIAIPYEVLFCMVNDDRINQSYNPDYQTILSVFREFTAADFRCPMNLDGLTNFKRNFHIMEKTGVIVRDSRFGLMISNVFPDIAYECIKTIAEMTTSFDSFENQFGNPDEEAVKAVIAGPSWGQYYDANRLPISTLEALGVELDRAPIESRAFSYYSEDYQEDPSVLEASRKKGGQNILLYGVPGSGKSWTIEDEYCPAGSHVERLVFHPDYTSSDFIGQILPVVNKEKDNQVTYEFTPGPFTAILRDAYANPTQEFILIVEELNRGNAPAIFGDIFQLLDRTVTDKTVDGITYPAGTSEYEITNKNMALEVYKNPAQKIRIPSNLSILATMNTSDQNVFTLDTAFQRRWKMRLIENSFDNVRPSLTDCQILDTGVTWSRFCEVINKQIVGNKAKMASSEDKRLGVYFVHEGDLRHDTADKPVGHDTIRAELHELLKADMESRLTEDQEARLQAIRDALKQNRIFPEKVIKYLWDDAFKFNPEAIFNTKDNKELDSLEAVIRMFVYENRGRARFDIFNDTIRTLLYEP